MDALITMLLFMFACGAALALFAVWDLFLEPWLQTRKQRRSDVRRVRAMLR